MTTNLLRQFALIGLAAAFVGACASKPKNFQPLPSTTDPNAAIETQKADLAAARERKIPELAPTEWRKSKKAFDEAVEARSKNKSNDKILEEVALSRAYLENANNIAKMNAGLMQPVMDARQSALDAKADTLAPKKFEKAEKYSRELAADAADDGYKVIEKRGHKAVERYNEARADAFSEEFTGRARAMVKTARDEGARKYAPTTLERVEDQIDSIDKDLRRQSRISPELAQKALEIEKNAEKLLALTRTSKSASSLTDEQVGQRFLNQDQRLAALMERSQVQQQRLSSVNRNLASTEQELEASRAKAKPAEAFEAVRSKFRPNEADVLMGADDRIIVRMKSLHFASGSAEVPTKQVGVLDKLAESIKDVNASKVIVEGHTDAVGKPALNRTLSEKRAESVGSYLSQRAALGEKIETEGFGDTKPLTTNKTKAGRAENRRVDVIIEM